MGLELAVVELGGSCLVIFLSECLKSQIYGDVGGRMWITVPPDAFLPRGAEGVLGSL